MEGHKMEEGELMVPIKEKGTTVPPSWVPPISGYEWDHIMSKMCSPYPYTINLFHTSQSIRKSILDLPPKSLSHILINDDLVGAICLMRNPNCRDLIDQEIGKMGDGDICSFFLNVVVKNRKDGYFASRIIMIFTQLYPILPMVICKIGFPPIYYGKHQYQYEFSRHLLDYVQTPNQLITLDPFRYSYVDVMINTLVHGKKEFFWTIFNQFDHFSLGYKSVHYDHYRRSFGYNNYCIILDTCLGMLDDATYSDKETITSLFKILFPIFKNLNFNDLLCNGHFNILRHILKKNQVKKFIMVCRKYFIVHCPQAEKNKSLDYIVKRIIPMIPLFRTNGIVFSSLIQAFPNLLSVIKPMLSFDEHYYLTCQAHEKIPTSSFEREYNIMCEVHEKIPHHKKKINILPDISREKIRSLLEVCNGDYIQLHDQLPGNGFVEIVDRQHGRGVDYIVLPSMYVLIDEAIKTNAPNLEYLIEFVKMEGDSDRLLQACIYYHLPDVFRVLRRKIPSHQLMMAVINDDHTQVSKLIEKASTELKNNPLVSVWDIVKGDMGPPSPPSFYGRLPICSCP